MSVTNAQNDRDAIAPSTAAPVSGCAGMPDSGVPSTDDPEIKSAGPTRWSLVSHDGRATMRLSMRFVIGSGSCCDLCLSDHGITTHHAMLTVEDGLAYVTPMSDAPTLLDGEPITGRCSLRHDAALTFGGAMFRVQQEGPIEGWQADESEWKKATAWKADETDWEADVTESEVSEVSEVSEIDATLSETDVTASRADATPSEIDATAFEADAALPPKETERSAPAAPTAGARRAAAPHVDPGVARHARSHPHAPPRRRRTGWIGWVLAVAAIAAAVRYAPTDVFEWMGWNRDAAPAKVDSVTSSATPPTVTAASKRSSTTQPVTLDEPGPASIRVEPASPPPAANVQHSPANAPTSNSVATLLSEAAALEAKGQWVTPGQNAAQRYAQVLETQPDSEVARARLDHIVGGVASDASDMILRQRFEGARRLLEQLSAAIPEDQRALVGKEPRRQWRVVQLLLGADALMQQYRLVGPDDPNAVGLLREALQIDPNNAIADEMLSKAYGLQAERERQ
ncbi:MAG TPA: FHA domain-containing protein [Pseudomonadales bacterium]|nr:FHA domain-containing protein [Pseudomonadales bacterium]